MQATTDNSAPEARANRKLLGIVSGAQGLFYLAGAGWALVDIDSFEAVTGPKTDDWLVKTVALLLLVSGGLFLYAAWRQRVSGEIVALAVGNAAALTIIDLTYVGLGRISAIYLLDALAHCVLLAAWAIAIWLPVRGSREHGGDFVLDRCAARDE